VDIGAYEFQSPQSTLSCAWLEQYGLPIDGSADLLDLDGDGHNNWQEWRAWTNPTNSLSALRLLMPLMSTNGLLIRWQSVSSQTYFLERGTDLGTQPGFIPLASDYRRASGHDWLSPYQRCEHGTVLLPLGRRKISHPSIRRFADPVAL